MAECRCTACGWEGDWDACPQMIGSTSPDEIYCPSCQAFAGPDGEMLDLAYETEQAATEFERKLANDLAQHHGIDNARRATVVANMRVPSFEEKEAERLRMAKHFMDKGTQ